MSSNVAGTLVAVAAGRTVVVYDAANDKQQAFFLAAQPVSAVALSDDGAVLAIGQVCSHGDGPVALLYPRCNSMW
jgi:nitrite reductase/ring-hydroxylating ferredoxin subunit